MPTITEEQFFLALGITAKKRNGILAHWYKQVSFYKQTLPTYPTYFHAVLLLVSHGATVLTCSLPELGGCLTLDDPSFVPLIEGTVLLLFLFLGSLMLQWWSADEDEEEEESPGLFGHATRGGYYLITHISFSYSRSHNHSTLQTVKLSVCFVSYHIPSPSKADVPRCLGNVLWNMGVDVPEERIKKKEDTPQSHLSRNYTWFTSGSVTS